MQCDPSLGLSMIKEPIIIALSGRKGGGKNAVSSFIAGHYQYHMGFAYQDSPCEELAFADGIKDFCVGILGLEHKQCYGSDDEKNTPTQYLWKDTPFWHLGDTRVFMSSREVMQVFGTECVRSWFGNVWAEATVRKIQKMALGLAIVTDNRFPNEVDIILGQPKGYIIRLTRTPYAGSDLHPSETALDDFNWDRPNCFVLDNAHMTKEEQNNAVIPILEEIFQQGVKV